jgi:hypothetical protein
VQFGSMVKKCPNLDRNTSKHMQVLPRESLNRPSLWIKFFFGPVCLVSHFNLALVKRLARLFLVAQAVAWCDFYSFRRTSTVVWRDRDWPVRAE